jgi:nucleotide-binding universal stress UspA family protein
MSMELKRILVPVDFSPQARAALRHAVDLARLGGATIDLLHVVPQESRASMLRDAAAGRPIGKVPEQVYVAGEEQLRALLTTIPHDGVKVTPIVEPGADAAATAVRLATELKPDLIVMGTHGRVGLAELILGSVAQRVITTAPCPVLTVRV